MNLKDVSVHRLINQNILATKTKTVRDVVFDMGAIQAQDYKMAKWAIGVRSPGSTELDVDHAIDNVEIIRTHVLRPTWHFVSPEDLIWMRELTANKAKSLINSRDKALGLTKAIIDKSKNIIEQALSNGEHLTGEELACKLEKNRIDTGSYRAWHLFYKAELDGIICSGKNKNGKPTFALLDERVPISNKIIREEALFLLAKKYFTSHGPATIDDFSWWSGLSIKECRKAVEMNKNAFISEKIGTQTYFFSSSFSYTKTNNKKVFLLPAFDEFIIAYKNRSASLLPEQHKKTISNNGIFRPMIVVNGQITGIWKRTIQKDKVLIELNLFQSQSKEVKNLIKKEALKLGQFLNKKIEVL